MSDLSTDATKKPRTFLFLTQMAASSGAFKAVVPILEARGHRVLAVIGDGQPLAIADAEIEAKVGEADLVILGMSPAPKYAAQEIRAAEIAKRLGKPFGFYGDAPRCWARARSGAWFEGVADAAAFYTTLNDEDAQAAEAVFPKALCVANGNPMREAEAFANRSRAEVRAALGVADDEHVVLAPGTKNAVANILTWGLVQEALRRITRKDAGKFRLVLATHPGDRTVVAVDPETKADLKLYMPLVDYAPVPTLLQEKRLGGMSTADLLSGADVVVECGSAIAIAAAYRGVPVVTLPIEVLMAQIEKTSGSRELEAVESRISEMVAVDPEALAQAFLRLVTPWGSGPMRARQAAAYPVPKERGAAARGIAGFLEDLVESMLSIGLPPTLPFPGAAQRPLFFLFLEVDVRFLF